MWPSKEMDQILTGIVYLVALFRIMEATEGPSAWGCYENMSHTVWEARKQEGLITNMRDDIVLGVW